MLFLSKLSLHFTLSVAIIQFAVQLFPYSSLAVPAGCTPEKRANFERVLHAIRVGAGAEGELLEVKDSLKNQLILDFAECAWRDFPSLKGHNDREPVYHGFLKLADRLVPSLGICGYFHDCYYKNILNLKGVQRILDGLHLSKKYGSTFEGAAAIELSQIQSYVKNLRSEKFEGERLVAVQPSGKHITPLFVKKVGDEFQFISLDTLGESAWNYNYGQEIEKEISQTQISYRFYKYAFRRQNDGISCAIFSLRDFVMHAKINLFSWIAEKQIPPGELKTLPVPYFLTSQAPETHTPYLSEVLWVGKKAGQATLQSVKDDYSYRFAEGRNDSYTRQHAYRYFWLLLSGLQD